MGLNFIGSGKGSCIPCGDKNPNPSRFKIEKLIELENTYVEINYPDAKNYEGNKVLVFKGQIAKEILSRSEIDPHFEEDGLPLLARLRPDFEGKWLGMAIAKGLQDLNKI